MSAPPEPLASLDSLFGRLASVDAASSMRVEGHVDSVIGLAVRAALPNAKLADLCTIERSTAAPLLGEIVGFDRATAIVMPYGTLEGVSPGDAVVSTCAPLSVMCSAALVGRVLDGMGKPFDGKGPIDPTVAVERRPIMARPPHPLERARITAPMPTGVRALDALLMLGVGQRVGLFAGSGVGKSTLL